MTLTVSMEYFKDYAVDIWNWIKIIAQALIIRTAVEIVIRILSRFPRTWPESWPTRRTILITLGLCLFMVLLSFVSLSIRIYFFGSPDPTIPSVLEFTIAIALLVVGVYLYDVVVRGIRMVKKWKWRRRQVSVAEDLKDANAAKPLVRQLGVRLGPLNSTIRVLGYVLFSVLIAMEKERKAYVLSLLGMLLESDSLDSNEEELLHLIIDFCAEGKPDE